MESRSITRAIASEARPRQRATSSQVTPFRIVLFGPAASTTIQGNIIGLDVTGTARLGNCQPGHYVESANNVIGGDVAAAGNVNSATAATAWS
jgi:hypothetical protein